ncbi:MAG: hypothetical protein F6K16_04415 [Symploca sp. SIO2B6]|nr:hypothetical protein [Symploca sp. SIO2B6]
MARREAKNLKELLLIRQNNLDSIESVNLNLGSALGYKYTNGIRTNHPAILVFVPDKIDSRLVPESQRVPKEFETTIGTDTVYCYTDVVRGSKASPGEELKEPPPLEPDNIQVLEELRQGRIGIIGGVQLGAFEGNERYVGTAACAVMAETTGRVGLLTNQHVAGSIGRQIYHPRPGQHLIGQTQMALEYLTDQVHWDGIIDERDAFVRVDCAFVSIRDSVKELLKPGLHRLGALGQVMPIDLETMDIIGTEVISIGRTRGIQSGVVAAYAYEFFDEGQVSVYTDMLIIGNQPGNAFSTYGDSGKLIVTKNGLRPVALLWGGWQERLRKTYEQENWTYAIDLSKVLKYLRLSIINN